MRTCKRTFFNKLFQPYRIGKPIYRKKYSALVDKRRRNSLIENERNSRTPKMGIIGRHAIVKCYGQRFNYKKHYSKFVKRARLND